MYSISLPKTNELALRKMGFGLVLGDSRRGIITINGGELKPPAYAIALQPDYISQFRLADISGYR
jgi:hypothetical protein